MHRYYLEKETVTKQRITKSMPGTDKGWVECVSRGCHRGGGFLRLFAQRVISQKVAPDDMKD